MKRIGSTRCDACPGPGSIFTQHTSHLFGCQLPADCCSKLPLLEW